jgi:hypothetical protein
MLVRNLRPLDINDLMILMNYYKDEINVSDEQWDENSLIQSVKRYASNAQYTFLVAIDNQRLVGLCAGTVVSEVYNTELKTLIQMFFLLPSHRNQENYKQLYNEFVNWSTLIGVDKIGLSDIGDNPKRIKPIGDMLGFNTSDYILLERNIE